MTSGPVGLRGGTVRQEDQWDKRLDSETRGPVGLGGRTVRQVDQWI